MTWVVLTLLNKVPERLNLNIKLKTLIEHATQYEHNTSSLTTFIHSLTQLSTNTRQNFRNLKTKFNLHRLDQLLRPVTMHQITFTIRP